MCQQESEGGCFGKVRQRPSVTGTGNRIARCDRHWHDRLWRAERSRQGDTSQPPPWAAELAKETP